MSRWFPRSIAGQLVALLLAALAASQILMGVMFSGERDEAVRNAWRAEFVARIASVARLVQEAPPEVTEIFLAASKSRWIAYSVTAAPAASADFATEGDRGLAVQLEAALESPAPGPVRVHSNEDDTPALARWLAAARAAVTGRKSRSASSREEPRLAISIPIADGRWFNVELTGRSQSPRRALLPVLSVVLMGAAALLAVALMVRRITKPLSNLAVAAEGLGKGEPVSRLAVAGPDEVRKVTAAFNEMNARLTRFLEDRTRMLAAISHDLRTPITALRVRAEFVEDDETRTRMIETLDDMKRMTEATLSFARDEATAEESRIVDVAALLASLVDDLADLGHDIDLDAPDAAPMNCRPASLKRAFSNVIENAVRYGNRAHLRLADADGALVLTVDDEGPGIPEDQLHAVFEPFVRLETSRSRETGGAGLGLAIARSIVLSHGGDITLSNRSGGGLRAEVRLPR